MESLYLQRYAWKQPLFPDMKIQEDTGIIIVLPAYNEPEVMQAIHSLQQCTPPDCDVLILVIFNEPTDEADTISSINQASYSRVLEVDGPFRILYKHIRLPPKKAGVGLARKIGMDEAVRFYRKTGKEGIITCFDADCTCDPNFLVAIENHFRDLSNQTGLVFYEHPIDRENKEAIVNYELYLRYYVNALRWAGFPYAFQTLGSCISVRSTAYQKQGGMNTRKAGEDFYFIHKMTALGGVGEINTTTVYPSPRVSDRVPFGTGHAIQKYLEESDLTYPVYSPQLFEDLTIFLGSIQAIYLHQQINDMPLPDSVKTFLHAQGFPSKLKELLRETSSYDAFKKRFFYWFDGLKLLKFVHFSRDHYHPNIGLDQALTWLNTSYLNNLLEGSKRPDLLIQLRNADRKAPFYIR